MKVIESLVPPGGWHFNQEGHKVEASTYRDLLQAVLEWRLANNRMVGNVQQDVNHYICSKWPHQCQPGADSVEMKARVGKMVASGPTKTDELTRWALEMQAKPGVSDLVLPQEATFRARVCDSCDRNVSITHGCGSCRANLERLLVLLRRGKEVEHIERLRFCRETSQDIRTAIWLRKDLLRKSNNLPTFCWMI